MAYATHRSRRGVGAVIAVGLAAFSLVATSTEVAAKPDRSGKQSTSTEDSSPRGKKTTETSTTETSLTADSSLTSDASLYEMSTTDTVTAESTTETQLATADDSGWERTSLAEVTEQIGAEAMWAAGFTGEGIDVAVIDTGVAPVAELATADVFVGPDLSFEGGIDEVAGLDTYGHGTHMAGIIAARTPGADPLAPQPGELIGVAPDAGIVSVKVADNTGAVDVSQVIAAIDWVVQNRNRDGLNIRVLNLSYNTTGTQSYVDDPLSKAVENAWRHGIVVVVSAGNEGRGAHTLANPATNPTVLAVSAAELWPYGWYTPTWAPTGDGVRNPDVVAPGVSIMSLRVPGSRIDVNHPAGRVSDDDRLFLGSGTSQAAAVVSGAAALLLEQRPDLTPDEIKQLLMATATPMQDKETLAGAGAIDLRTAMAATVDPVTQDMVPATGLGSLDAARGDDRVVLGGVELIGEYTVTGAAWDPIAWVQASEAATAWSGTDDWSGSSWSGSSWSGSSWSGSSWSGSSWSGSSWSGSSWSGSSWSGSSWSGSSWSGSSWSGSSWSGSSWSGSSWSGSSWS